MEIGGEIMVLRGAPCGGGAKLVLYLQVYLNVAMTFMMLSKCLLAEHIEL